MTEDRGPGTESPDDDDERYAARTAALKASIPGLARGDQHRHESDEAPVELEPFPTPERPITAPVTLDAGLLDAIRQVVRDSVSESLTAALASTTDEAAALESRLAALEDAIDGVGDRLEALTRVAGAGGADQAGTSLAA
ncbi:MAG TPA: hypothetical protein VGN54_14585, partial [Mycobacteriales bacterium]|nr:hypothetical protein [Mycobacteriales bacterium]